MIFFKNFLMSVTFLALVSWVLVSGVNERGEARAKRME